MTSNTGEILGERFSARDGVVIIDDNKPVLFRIRKFEDHRSRSARGVQVMVQRQGQKTSKNVYVTGDSGVIFDGVEFSFNEVNKSTCVLSIHGWPPCYRLEYWVQEVFSGNLELGLGSGEESEQFEPAWHRSIFRALAQDSLLLIGSAKMPTYLLRLKEVLFEQRKVLVEVCSQDSTRIIEVVEEEFVIDPRTKIRLGFIGNSSKSVEIDITTSNWLYRADEWLSRLLSSNKMTAQSATDSRRLDSANLV